LTESGRGHCPATRRRHQSGQALRLEARFHEVSSQENGSVLGVRTGLDGGRGAVLLSGTQIALTDETLAKPVRLDVDQIALTAKYLSTDLTRSIPLTLSCRVEETGTIKAAGDLVPSTLASKGSVTLAKLPLSLASAYVADAAMRIPSGNLGGKLDWRMGDKDQISGSLQADGFRVTEGRSKAEIAGFKSLGVQKFTLQFSPLALNIGQIDVSNHAARF
jgi:Domain of Unknown Function (DUF748).